MGNPVYADQQVGATADIQLAAAFALLPNGGTVDCFGYGATTQTIAKTVVIPGNITLRCDPVTKFQPASAALDMFILSPDAKVDGLTVNTSNQSAYSGKVITIAPGSEDVNHTWLHNVHLVSAFIYPNPPTATGIGFYIEASGTPGRNTSFVSVSNLRIQGFGDGIYLKASGSDSKAGPGYINGNQFVDVHISYSYRGIHLEGSNGGQVNGNNFVAYDYESGGPGTTGLYTEGTVAQNTFSGLRIWDTDISMVLGAGTRFNQFIGDIDGIPTDFPTANCYILGEGGSIPYTVVVFFVGLYRWLKSKL